MYIFRIFISCLINIYVLSCFSLTLCDPVDHNPPDSSVYGDFLGKNTGEACHALLRGFSPPRDLTHISYVSCIGSSTWEAPISTLEGLYLQIKLNIPYTIIII